MSMEVTVRPYRPEDLETILQITARAFVQVSVDAKIERHAGLLEGTTWQERKAWDVANEVQGNPAGCLVAEADGQVVGYVTTSVNRRLLLGRLPNLAVDPQFHGQGTGKALLRAAFRYFQAEGLRNFRIETTADNEVGQALYPRYGFREMARQIQYYMTLEEAAASELGADIFAAKRQDE